jgi:hypothetical protein
MTPRFEQPSELPPRLTPKELKSPGVKATNSGASGNVPMENYYDYMLIGEISVGTPAQTVRVNINPCYRFLQIVADCASNIPSVNVELPKKSPSSDSSDFTWGSGSSSAATCDNYDKLTYNALKSSTATMLKSSSYPAGTLVNDMVHVSDLNLNLTLVDSNSVDLGMTFDYLPIDGFLGISSTTPGDDQSDLVVLNQLMGQLDQPLWVMNLNRDYQQAIDEEYDTNDVNEFTLGTDKVNGCSSEWQWHACGKLGSINDGAVSITSISTTDTDGSAKSVSAKRQVFLRNYFLPFYCSNEVEALIVNATGATWNADKKWYVTPCDQVASGRNVSINVDGGGTINLTPQDLHVKYDGVCYLYTYGYYAETSKDHKSNAMVLGQTFINNHCVASNFGDNTVGITDKL